MSNLLYIFYKEMNFLFHDRGIMIFILFVPLAYPLLYAYVYGNEVVRDVPVMVVDDDNSHLSRDFLRRMDATEEVKYLKRCNNMEEAKLGIMKHEAYGIVHIPESFSKDLMRGGHTTVGLYSDMSSMLYYKALIVGLTEVYLDVSKEIKVEEHLASSSMTTKDEKSTRMPVEYDRVSFFNPKSGFAAFLVPPVFMLILQQTLFLGIGMHMGVMRERHRNIFLPDKRYRGPFTVLMARTAFYLMLYLVMAIYAFTFATNSFELPSNGNYFTLLAFIVPYLLSCIFCSFTLSTFVYRREDCILIFVFSSVPLLFFSGISWPTPSMPPVIHWLSYLFPSSLGMNDYVNIMGMGGSLSDIKSDYIALWAQVVFYFLISYYYYIRQFAKCKSISQKSYSDNRI